MAEPFSTNELFLRSDRIAFGKIPPGIPEQTLILPDVTGKYLLFGLSSLVSTNNTTGTLEKIFPENASFTFDNLNKRLGINNSTPQYALDISTLTGVRIQGGTLIANASGLISVPTASLFSTLPSYVFAPGTIPPTAIASTGAVIPGLSVPTSALFSTLPTYVFAPSTIPLVSLQSTGIIVASSFIGDGHYLSNIPLGAIDGDLTGNFFKPNTIPLQALASTGTLWIRESGAIYAPVISSGQAFVSSITANNISTSHVTATTILTSNIVVSSFTTDSFDTNYLSVINIKANTIQALNSISSGSFSGDGLLLTNLNPANLNNVIPSNKFGYRLIAVDAINPYGNFTWEAGNVTFKTAAPVNVLGRITASTFQGGYFVGDGSLIYNINAISTPSLVSTVAGLGSISYISSSQLLSTVAGLSKYTSSFIDDTEVTSTIQGLGTYGYVSTPSLVSSLQGLGSLRYLSTASLVSSLEGLGSLRYVSTASLVSTTEAITNTFSKSGFLSTPNLTSTVQGLGSASFVSTLSLQSTVASLTAQELSTSAGNSSELKSTVQGLGSAGYLSSIQLISTVQGLGSASYLSSTQLTSSIAGLGSSRYLSSTQLISTVQGLGSASYVSTPSLVSTTEAITNTFSKSGFLSSPNLISTVQGLGSASYVSTLSLVSTTDSITNIFSKSGFLSTPSLVSTVQGLGSASYLSTPSLVSTTDSIVNIFSKAGFLSTPNLTSTVQGLGTSDYLSTASLVSTTDYFLNQGGFIFLPDVISTVEGLGTYGYVSTSYLDESLQSTTDAFRKSGYLSTPNLTSTVIGLGSAQYVSTLSLISTTDYFRRAGFLSSPNLRSTVQGLGSAGYLSSATFFSTIEGLGSLGYVSSTQLRSTVQGLGSANYVSTASLVSTTEFFSRAGFLSSPNLISTTAGLEKYISSFIDPKELASSIIPLISATYFTTQLKSTVQGLGSSRYISSAQLISTTAGLEKYISSFIDPKELASSIIPFISSTYFTTQLTSTVQGLGSANYVSTLSLVSTTDFFRRAGFLSTPNLRSTVQGLGSASYVSTASLVSTAEGLLNNTFLGIESLKSSIIGLGSAGYVSTLTLEEAISSFSTSYGDIGSLTKTPSTFSTFSVLTSSLQTSTLIAGAGLFIKNGTNSASAYGIEYDTLTLQTSCNAYESGIASLAFATNTNPYPLGRIYAIDTALSGSVLSEIVFQNVPVSLTSFNSNYSYTGSDQTFTVPVGVTTMQISLWGAGGAGGVNAGPGGAGAFVQGTLVVSPGQTYTIVVGEGGATSVGTPSYGGGGGSESGNSQGGGRSAILLNLAETITTGSGSGSAITFTTSGNHGLELNQPVIISGLTPSGFNGNFIVDSIPALDQFTVLSSEIGASSGIGTILAEVANAGGGGGGGLNGGSGGAASYSGTAFSAPDNGPFTGGTGGTQTGGGISACGPAYNGSVLQGGTGCGGASGGGGGYYGGGGGYWAPGGAAGGGGGSSYTSYTGFTLTLGYNSPNLSEQAPGQSVPGYVTGIAEGGPFQGTGGNGLVLINSIGGTITEAMRIGSNGYLGIGTTTPAYRLDVVGTGHFDNLSTMNINLCTINGYVYDYPLNSSIIGLGSSDYISSSQLISTVAGLEEYVSSFIDPLELASSILPFISSTYFATSLVSTVDGLGSAGYVSTFTLQEAISSLSTSYGNIGAYTTIPSTFSTFSILTSSIQTSTVQARTISTLDLWVSSINGALPGSGSLTAIPSTLSTYTILTSTLTTSTFFAKIAQVESTFTSSLQVTGPGLFVKNGTNSISLYGVNYDTLTLQTSCNAYQSGIASLAFATSSNPYPLGRIYAIDSAISGSPISQLVFQNVPISATSFTSNYSYTGSGQTFTVPVGVTTMQVTLWGAGGGSPNAGSNAGAGAFVQGVLTVTPGQVYTVVVGQGGGINTYPTNGYGGGGWGFGGAGGGRSAIQLNLTVSITSATGSSGTVTYTTSAAHGLQLNQPVIISGLSPSGFNGNYVVASIPATNQFVVSSSQTGSSTGTGSILGEIVNVGGGGGGGQGGRGGYATYSGTAASGPVGGGGGGSQTSGGAADGGNSSAGTLFQGGNSAFSTTGGGAGGGYYGGGGGGGSPGAAGTGGGGGSSYTSHTAFALSLGLNSPNSQNQAPGTSVAGYVAGVAVGASTNSSGGNGYVILNSIGGSITEAMRIGSNGYLGIATTSPAYPLDVAGIGHMSNLYLGTNSTLTTQQFYGLFGNYNNTVLAEISTGAGTQELLMFKGSSINDRVRVQTTGNFVIETGVSARLWSTNTNITRSNATPAFIINSSSNVGIQTASPGATLDVAGTGRFVTVSTQQIFTSSLFTPSLVASSITTSTFQTFLTSTAAISVSTIITRDQTVSCNAGVIFQKNSLLYYNSLFIFAGTRQAYGQILQVGIGVGTGGTITTYSSGLSNYQLNTFTTSGTYAVSGGSLYADIFVLGGGGGGGGSFGGGGGGGGFIYAPNVFLTSGSYTVTIGQGGTGSLTNGTNGSNSVFTNGLITYTGFGGGTGGSYAGSFLGSNGGCGGGGAGNPSSAGGTGSQGYSGGTGGGGSGGAGGGGMGQAGTSSGGGANGGNGSTITITGTAVIYGGGGAGGNLSALTTGGTGGGGNGGSGGNITAGTNGLGGGGGGGNVGSGGSGPAYSGANGGSGIVIIRSPPG